MANRLFKMTFIGLKTVVISHLSLFCLLIIGVFALPCAAQEGIVPERNISMIDGDLVTPGWKTIWDKARHQVRAEQYSQATFSYSELFKLKSNIEEANWEYCKILLKVGDYKVGSKIVASLLEKNPNKIAYLFIAGRFAAQNKDWGLSVKLFGKVYENDPVGQFSEAALEGLVFALRSMGKRELALPLAERLAARQPENLTLLREMAIDAYRIGENQKTRSILKRLSAVKEVNDKILTQVVKIFDSQNGGSTIMR